MWVVWKESYALVFLLFNWIQLENDSDAMRHFCHAQARWPHAPFPHSQSSRQRMREIIQSTGWDYLYLYSLRLSFFWMKVLVVTTSICLGVWDKGGFLCGPVPWSSGKQPYLLILLNKWPAFMLSLCWNKKDRVRRYIIACEINALCALLCGWW